MAGNRKTASFDSYLKEHRANKVVEKRYMEIGGKEYEIAPVLPASFVLAVQRMQKEKGEDANVPPEIIITMADSIFGPGRIESIALEHGLDIEELGELFRLTIESYTDDDDEEEEEEDPTSPPNMEGENRIPELTSLKNGT